MPFVAEDGSGVSGANSLVSVSDADAYFTLRNNMTWDAKSTEEKQASLLEATAWVEGQYRGTWIGTIKSTNQGLSWPREKAYDPDRRLMEGVPQQIKDAVCELALAALDESLAPAVERGGRIISETIGPISTTYEAGAPSGRTFPMVRMLLQGLSRKSIGSISLVRT